MFTKKFLDRRKEILPKFQLNDLVLNTVLKKTFSKVDTTNCSCNLNNFTENVKDTVPSYKFHNLPERYNEVILKKTELSLKENDSVMKKQNLK